MRHADYYIGKYFNEFRQAVEGAPASFWYVFGTVTFVAGVLFLRGSNANH